MSEKFSDEAKELMCGLFFFGKGTIKSSPPHAMLSRISGAMDELIGSGLVTKKPFNKFDIWLYEPTERMEPEADKHKKWYYSRHLPEIAGVE